MQEIIRIHNRFDVSVVDVNTGEEKQKAVGFNVVTNNFFNSKLAGSPNGRYEDLFVYIAYGSGSGTPAITDNALFSVLNRKGANTLETVYSYPTSYIQKQIKIEATENVGAKITEVGFESSYRGIWDTYYYLNTHAMLQDSEGNQISIQKTDTDVVYITATFYCTTVRDGFGAGAIYPPADQNILTKWLLTGSMDGGLYISRYQLSNSIDLFTKNSGYKSINLLSGTGNTNTLRVELPLITFLDTEMNNQIIKHIGVPGIGAVTFPNHEIFPPYKVEKIAIGTGDGTTKEFNIKAPLIMEGTETIYVNGTVMVKDIDYTIDYESNCGDWYENYHSACFSCKDTNVSFGNLKDNPPSSYYYYDPVAFWGLSDKSFYPSGCIVTADKPIFIDFKGPKECNTLKLDIITVPTAQIDKLVIEYSNDNISWTKVSTTRTNQIWKWQKTSARYWRVYIPSYSWSYSLSSTTPMRDGRGYGTSFFLGKTVPGLSFVNPPAVGASIEATYSLEYPFKTANNLIRFGFSIQLQRG